MKFTIVDVLAILLIVFGVYIGITTQHWILVITFSICYFIGLVFLHLKGKDK